MLIRTATKDDLKQIVSVESEGISESIHGNAVWYQMRL